MTPHLQQIVPRLLVAALIGLGAGPLALHAQDTTDIRTFQGISFERPEAPKTYMSVLPPLTTLTPYTLILPADQPSILAILAISGVEPFQLYWYAGQTTTLELISNTSLRRPATSVEGGDLGGTSFYSNNFQGSFLGVNGTTGPMSTSIGGSDNLASGSHSTTGGGDNNEAKGSTSTIVGGFQNLVTGNDGAIFAGTNNSVTGTYSVVLGGNTNSAGSNFGFVGGGANNSVTTINGTIFGGMYNTGASNSGAIFGGYANTNPGTQTVVGGGTNNSVTSAQGAIAGGFSNTVGAGSAGGFIGGGASNTLSGGSSASILGGSSNTIGGNYAAIGGGQTNTASTSHSTVGGGQNNTASGGTHALVLSGLSNSATASAAVSLGGSANAVSASHSVALGGRSMTVSAQGTLGMNAGSSSMAISNASVAVLANMDVWLADNNNTPSSLRLFEAYNLSGSIVGVNINYVAFQAPTTTYNEYSSTYTLPDRVGADVTFLSVAASPAPTTETGTLEWLAIPTYDVVAHASTIAAAFPAATDNADIIRVTSTGTAATRVMTLRNGITNGMIVTVQFSGANAIRLSDADLNLDLQGAADFDMDANDTLTLVWDAASAKWIEIGRMVQN